MFLSDCRLWLIYKFTEKNERYSLYHKKMKFLTITCCEQCGLSAVPAYFSCVCSAFFFFNSKFYLYFAGTKELIIMINREKPRVYVLYFLLAIAIIVSVGMPLSASELDRYVSLSRRVTVECDDATFLRRTYLLLTGKLPTIVEMRSFLADNSSTRRAELIDNLVASDESTRYMQMRWGDILRIKSEFPSNLWPNGVQAYNSWLYHHLMQNTPYDEMVRDLLLSTGSNFKAPAVNFYRAFLDRSPQTIYDNINLLFLGRRVTTDNGAKCFSQLRYKSTKEWKEEIIYLDVNVQSHTPNIILADGTHLSLPDRGDWRVAYVDWLTSQEQFAGVMVNRLWYWIFGRGLVDEPDDWRADNPPLEAELLQHLTTYFIESGYDCRKLLTYILNSQTYQAPAKEGSLFEARRLPAEVIVDALADITGAAEIYQSRVPEPFTTYPQGTRSRDLGDATVSSSALELFGKVSRDVSLESQRNNSITGRQLLYLMNSTDLESQIRRSPLLKRVSGRKSSTREMVNVLTLTILARPATEREIDLFADFAKSSSSLAADIIWTLINSNEFLYIY